jgi:hypothetical protein
MCNYYESKMTFKECEATPKHVIQKHGYDKCEEAKSTGYVCDDPAPAKGTNGEIKRLYICFKNDLLHYPSVQQDSAGLYRN